MSEDYDLYEPYRDWDPFIEREDFSSPRDPEIPGYWDY